MSKVKVAVFASGSGSNFQAMMEHGNLACEIVLLVCDQPHASVIDKAAAFGVPTFVFETDHFSTRAEYEQEITKQLKGAQAEWVFLAGYMRIIGSTLLQAFPAKIINIHPSLLPAFPGMDAIGQAFRAKVSTTGVTVHYIDEGIDTGPIIAQEEVDIQAHDTQDSLQRRIQKTEHRLYPQIMNQVIREQATSNESS